MAFSTRLFTPHLTSGGTVAAGGQVILDSGVMNPELLTPILGAEVGKVWAKPDLKSRMQAIIVHEITEHETGSHAAALKEAPKTLQPIGQGAKKILEAMAR